MTFFSRGREVGGDGGGGWQGREYSDHAWSAVWIQADNSTLQCERLSARMLSNLPAAGGDDLWYSGACWLAFECCIPWGKSWHLSYFAHHGDAQSSSCSGRKRLVRPRINQLKGQLLWLTIGRFAKVSLEAEMFRKQILLVTLLLLTFQLPFIFLVKSTLTLFTAIFNWEIRTRPF